MMLRETNALVIFSCCYLILSFPNNSYCINPLMISLRECLIIRHFDIIGTDYVKMHINDAVDRVFMNWIILVYFHDA